MQRKRRTRTRANTTFKKEDLRPPSKKKIEAARQEQEIWKQVMALPKLVSLVIVSARGSGDAVTADSPRVTKLTCDVCGCVVSGSDRLKKHLKLHHPLRRRCTVCGIMVHHRCDVAEHIRTAHGLGPQARKCGMCDHIAETTKDLERHGKVEHLYRIRYGERYRLQRCQETVDGEPCGERFLKIPQMRRHLSEVHGIAAASDIVRHHFASMDEFYAWKSSFEEETGEVFRIGYGRRRGQMRFMCRRSGTYKPLLLNGCRQRQQRRHGTLKLGFNCTADITARFPDEGGVSVEVHPFHYGHQCGDRPMPLTRDARPLTRRRPAQVPPSSKQQPPDRAVDPSSNLPGSAEQGSETTGGTVASNTADTGAATAPGLGDGPTAVGPTPDRRNGASALGCTQTAPAAAADTPAGTAGGTRRRQRRNQKAEWAPAPSGVRSPTAPAGGPDTPQRADASAENQVKPTGAGGWSLLRATPGPSTANDSTSHQITAADVQRQPLPVSLSLWDKRGQLKFQVELTGGAAERARNEVNSFRDDLGERAANMLHVDLERKLLELREEIDGLGLKLERQPSLPPATEAASGGSSSPLPPVPTAGSRAIRDCEVRLTRLSPAQLRTSGRVPRPRGERSQLRTADRAAAREQQAVKRSGRPPVTESSADDVDQTLSLTPSSILAQRRRLQRQKVVLLFQLKCAEQKANNASATFKSEANDAVAALRHCLQRLKDDMQFLEGWPIQAFEQFSAVRQREEGAAVSAGGRPSRAIPASARQYRALRRAAAEQRRLQARLAVKQQRLQAAWQCYQTALRETAAGCEWERLEPPPQPCLLTLRDQQQPLPLLTPFADLQHTRQLVRQLQLQLLETRARLTSATIDNTELRREALERSVERMRRECPSRGSDTVVKSEQPTSGTADGQRVDTAAGAEIDAATGGAAPPAGKPAVKRRKVS